jgi:hypothetical protein
MTKSAPNPPLRYGAMRLRWCGLALKAFITRWGVYVLVTGVVLSAGASGWEQVLQAIAAVLVLPLFSASQHGWLLLPATFLQALAGAAAVWGARSLLWPKHWAESERALPLPRSETARSDLLVVLLVLTPLLLLYAAGAASVLAHRPAWLHPTQGRAVLALALAAFLSLGLGAGLLQWQRGYRAGVVAARPERHSAVVRAVTGPGALSAWRALILLPLWRGPARRTGVTLLAGTASLVLVALIPAALRWPAGWPWLLAAWAAVALLAATRINHLARLELTEMLQVCAVLPVNLRRLRWMQSALGLWPLLPGLGAVLIGIVVAPPAGLRPAVLLAWALACALACGMEVFAGQQEASDKSARWWFSLIVCVCLASEVLA